jgi:hypothetical protein
MTPNPDADAPTDHQIADRRCRHRPKNLGINRQAAPSPPQNRVIRGVHVLFPFLGNRLSYCKALI